jgi:uncharacterized membrane protein
MKLKHDTERNVRRYETKPRRSGTVIATESTESSYHNDYHKPHTVEDLNQRNVETIMHLEETPRDDRTNSDRIADAISNFCGSMSFVWAHLVIFASCIIINLGLLT